MNYTRKRPRDGPHDQPPPKRHDHKPQERSSTPSMKPPSTSAAKPSAPTEVLKPAAKKPIPPPPTKSTHAAEDTPKYNITDPTLKTDLPALLALLETVRNVSTEMVEKAISLGPDTAKSDESIQDLGRQGFIALAQFRTVHRHLHLEVDRRRQQLLQYGDTEFLEALQLSESSKYQLETFKMLVEAKPDLDDAVGLVSEEEWRIESVGHVQHPKEGDSEHKLTLKRIKYEEDRRRAMAVKLKEIPSQQNSLKSTLNTQTRDLDALKQKIREMASQMNLLKSSLKLEEPTLQQADSRASLLPQPLYNLYVQLISWIAVFGGEQVEVSISGSMDSAKRNAAQSSKQSRLKDSSPSPPNALSSSAPTSTSDTLLSSEECQKVHPLGVLLHFLVSTSALAPRKVSLMFEHLVNLNIVIVTPLNNEDPKILVNLFPGDNGLVSPNWSNRLQVMPTAQILPKRARAYKWVQALCGLHFQLGPSDASTPSSQPSSLAPLAASLTDTMELLKRRAHMKQKLAAVWSMLVSGRIDTSLPPIRPHDLPHTTVLRKWTEHTTAQAQTILNDVQGYYKEHAIVFTTKRNFHHRAASEVNTPVSSAMDVDNGADIGHIQWTDETVGFDAKQDATYFRATFGTSGVAQLCQVLVEVPPEYPSANPTFYITGSKELVPKEVALMTQVLRTLQPSIASDDPSSSHSETLVNYTLAWIRDCLDIHHELQKQGDSSKFNREDRYEPATHMQS